MTQANNDEGREYLTASEAAALAGITVRTLYRYIRSGRIKATRVLNGPYRFTREEVDSWFEVAS